MDGVVVNTDHDFKAMLWDGSISQAGDIIEWLEDQDVEAKYKESNETPDHRPRLQLYDPKRGWFAVYKEEWILVHSHGGFEKMSQLMFSNAFDRRDD